jgi:pantoate kinase
MEKFLATAFAPSGISGFFEICDHDRLGRPLKDPLRIGARGGGIGLTEGVTTKVSAKPAEDNRVQVSINGEEAPNALTTKTMVERLLRLTSRFYDVRVEHMVEVPIGAGFGTSAAGAVSCGLALSAAARLNVSFNRVMQEAHAAEVLCHTGLGSVEGMGGGGLVLVVKSGAVGYGLVDRIPIPQGLKVVAGSFRSIDKKTVLLAPEKHETINRLARETMRRIQASPTLETFLENCKAFALNTGLASDRCRELIAAAEAAGAIGASQNMIGETVHAVTTRRNLEAVRGAFLGFLADEKVLVSDIEFCGARLLSVGANPSVGRGRALS